MRYRPPSMPEASRNILGAVNASPGPPHSISSALSLTFSILPSGKKVLSRYLGRLHHTKRRLPPPRWAGPTRVKKSRSLLPCVLSYVSPKGGMGLLPKGQVSHQTMRDLPTASPSAGKLPLTSPAYALLSPSPPALPVASGGKWGNPW